jgi:hypothetical protein
MDEYSRTSIPSTCLFGVNRDNFIFTFTFFPFLYSVQLQSFYSISMPLFTVLDTAHSALASSTNVIPLLWHALFSQRLAYTLFHVSVLPMKLVRSRINSCLLTRWVKQYFNSSYFMRLQDIWLLIHSYLSKRYNLAEKFCLQHRPMFQ